MSLEQMLAVATSMVQILDSRRSIVEALHIKRLTFCYVELRLEE
ncbi:uncharacterized protein Y057_4045 [Fusarium fujikuroi]|nr:uncharacterized protein Y057_4045 [Fusarium fujikuroi]